MEPHKKAKIDAGRFRLISVLSLVDQMVDRILFGTIQRAEIEHCMERAGKTGWSPLPEGFFDILDFFDGPVLATDCTAFDWTYPHWLPLLILDSKLEQFKSYCPEYASACRNRFAEVLGPRCTIRLPSGERYAQTIWGVMKSGWLLTIALNSDAQDLITSLAWDRAYSGICPRLWAMGDDVLMRWQEGLDSGPLEAELLRAGILSKFATRAFEFSGFRFGRIDGTPFVDPLYPEKHKYLLAHTPAEDLEEVVSAYGLIYALATPPTKEWLLPLLREYARWSPSTYRAWAFGLMQGAKLALSGKGGGR